MRNSADGGDHSQWNGWLFMIEVKDKIPRLAWVGCVMVILGVNLGLYSLSYAPLWVIGMVAGYGLVKFGVWLIK